MVKIKRPFGMWSSPVTPTLLGARLRLSDVQWDSDGRTLLWVEGRSDRSVLVAREEMQAFRDLTVEENVRGGVGYGGGEFDVRGGVVVFAEKNGRLYRRSLGYDRPAPITPPFGQAAAPAISPDGRWVVYVHTFERIDSLGIAAASGKGWARQLVHGADFYMQPVWSPDGKMLAWVEWDHPQMPWDGTRLALATLAGEVPEVVEKRILAGSTDMPVFQPAFSPDGQWLSCVTNEGEWDQLVLINPTSGEKRVLVRDSSLLPPAWVQGMRVYGWSGDSRRIYYLTQKEGFSALCMVDVVTGAIQRLDLPEYTVLSQISVSPVTDRVACLASGPTVPDRVIVKEGGRVTVQRRSDAEMLPPEELPIPRSISWLAPDGTRVYGLYYPPTSARFESDGLPPAVVYIHGGPTSQTLAGMNSDALFFTSRGYGYLAVNYRGSTGYGRSYMLALRERWGEVDVEDAVGGAQALIDQKLADPGKLMIKGGSAGGYTVWNALIHYPGRFKAGLCSYGVSNLFTIAMDTHKFEERYTDSMVGPLPEAAGRYHAWSPCFHADAIRDAVAVFQGSEDKVVPPSQSESMVALMRANRVPHIYRVYEGEGHGFRKAENISAFFADMERFIQQYVLFSA